MKIELGHDKWWLQVNKPKTGEENHFQKVLLEVGDVDTEEKIGVEARKALTARQAKDSSFIGRISLDKLALTEHGFQASGVALEETGTFYPNGVYQAQMWEAGRLDES